MPRPADYILEQAGKDILRIFGEQNEAGDVEAMFYPAIGDPIPCMVWKNRGVNPQPPGFETTVPQTSDDIEGMIKDIGKVPERGEYFIINGERFDVQEKLEDDGFYYKVGVK